MGGGGSVHDVAKETEKSLKENGKMLGVSGGCSSSPFKDIASQYIYTIY